MTMDSIPIRAEQVPPVANDMAGTSKSVAGVLIFLSVILFIAMVSSISENKADRIDGSASYKAGYNVGQFVGVALFAGLPFWFGIKSARNASRATRAAKVAASDPTHAFRLTGKLVVVTDGAGVPRPDLSFKINGKLRTMLLAVPRAELVDKS